MNIVAAFFCVLLLCLTACTAETPEPPPTVAQPVETPTYTQQGRASWYGPQHDGRKTANGERFDMTEMTAAHRSLPFGTIVRVINRSNGETVKVRINDRGPYEKHRIIDLSDAAAKAVGIHDKGIAPVRLEVFASDQAPQETDQTATLKPKAQASVP